MTINRYVVRSTLVGAMGGLLFAFDTAVISATTARLTIAFGLSVRELGVAVSIALHWVMNAVFSGASPVVPARAGAYPFFFFAAMMTLQFFVVLLNFPETKQVSLE